MRTTAETSSSSDAALAGVPSAVATRPNRSARTGRIVRMASPAKVLVKKKQDPCYAQIRRHATAAQPVRRLISQHRHAHNGAGTKWLGGQDVYTIIHAGA